MGVIRVIKRDPNEWQTEGTIAYIERSRYRRPSKYTEIIHTTKPKFEKPLFREHRRKPKQKFLFHPWISDIYYPPKRGVRLEYIMLE